jgi:hypothetical protein
MHFFRKRRARTYQKRRNHQLALQEDAYLRMYRETVSSEGKTRVYVHQTGFNRQFTRYYHCTLDDDFSYYLTTGPETAEAVAFINTIDPSIVLPRQKVLLFFHEPLAYAHLYQTELDDAFAIEHDLEVVTHLPTARLFVQSKNLGRLRRNIPYVHFHHDADRNTVRAARQVARDKLICAITSGLDGGIPGYDARKTFIERLTEANPGFDFYGRYSKGAARIESYRGECASKWETLRAYKFNLVIENSLEDWYVSEKIFDSLICGCFPVYHGSNKVFDVLPADSFYYLADLDARSLADLNDFLDKQRSQIVSRISADYIYEHFSFYRALEGILLGKELRIGE